MTTSDQSDQLDQLPTNLNNLRTQEVVEAKNKPLRSSRCTGWILKIYHENYLLVVYVLLQPILELLIFPRWSDGISDQLATNSTNFRPTRPTSDQLPTDFRPTSDQLPTNFWPTSDQLPPNLWPTSDQLPTNWTNLITSDQSDQLPTKSTNLWPTGSMFDQLDQLLTNLTNFWQTIIPGWWFQTCFIFHNIWDNPSHWPIFFSGVETTNQILSKYMLITNDQCTYLVGPHCLAAWKAEPGAKFSVSKLFFMFHPAIFQRVGTSSGLLKTYPLEN